ncbi:hypothetical protein MRX96_016513 [Rhipicephalus microplus]
MPSSGSTASCFAARSSTSTERTLGDIPKDEDPHSVAACRARTQLRKLFDRGSGQQRDKALALHRQKLELLLL